MFQVWCCSQVWTPLCLNSSSSFSSRTALVPLRPFTTSQAHKKYSWTRSAVQPEDKQTDIIDTRWYKRCKQQKVKRSKQQQRVSNRQVCSGSGPAGCTVCQPASPTWPGGCSVAHVPPVDASFPAWASFCHQSPPERCGPPPVQMLLGVLLGRCLCPLWCHEAEQPAAQDGISSKSRSSLRIVQWHLWHTCKTSMSITPPSWLRILATPSKYTHGAESLIFSVCQQVINVWFHTKNVTLFRNDFLILLWLEFH